MLKCTEHYICILYNMVNILGISNQKYISIMFLLLTILFSLFMNEYIQNIQENMDYIRYPLAVNKAIYGGGVTGGSIDGINGRPIKRENFKTNLPIRQMSMDQTEKPIIQTQINNRSTREMEHILSSKSEKFNIIRNF